MVTNYEGENIQIKETLPLLPVRDVVIYPFMIIPLFIGRESSIQAVEESQNNFNKYIFLAAQKDIQAEAPEPSEIFEIGTIAHILLNKSLSDGRIKILVQGITKARISNFEHTAPFYKVKLNQIHTPETDVDNVSAEALIRNVKEQLEKVISLGKMVTPDLLHVVDGMKESGKLADVIAANLNLNVDEAQMILEVIDPIERLQSVNDILKRELEILGMQQKIKSQAHDEITKSQKEYFLREQIRAIKSELGDEGTQETLDEFQEFKQKVTECSMPEEVEKESLKQLARLEKMHPDSSEASILRTYLEWMTDLPWSTESEEHIDLDKAKAILDEDHFDLEKVKERILEYLAVRQLKGKDMKGPILCLAGPPGVGKTSLGKSIAKSIGREFVRLSLGGVKDEAEIRGHRRTYVGAMPGRFIQALKQAGTKNPVVMLDEIDKLGSDFRGDPSSALLEVLDPEQNNSFRDHYINLPFNLSNVMFIATANVIDNIPAPLRDRMELLNLTGYTQEDKIAIAHKYLIPKQMKENGISEEFIDFQEAGVEVVIKNFTSEAGLRNLERQIGSLCRKVAKKMALGEKEITEVTPESVIEMLGPPPFTKEDHRESDEVGVSTGLAWTSSGGQVLYIESTCMKGSGLTLTGQLGDVMKESANAALGYIRSKASKFGIDETFFENNEIHVHLPAGAIPKDGPSAGITMATALLSLATDLPICKDVAMTGEITLTGKILPIGGLKEKALAAMRLGIKTIIIPWKNSKDLIDIPEEYRERLNFVPVKNFDEVAAIALIGWLEHKKQIKNNNGSKRSKNQPAAAA